MLGFLIDRLKLSRRLDEIVVATTERREDAAVVTVAERHGVNSFRGSEDDVLGRFAAAAEAHGASVVVRISADNPLIDPDIVDRVVGALDDPSVDHVSTFARPSFPHGAGCAAFRRAVLDMAASYATDPAAREHVEPYMLESETVCTLYLEAPEELRRPEIMLSVDEEVDFQRVERVASALVGQKGISFSTKDVIDWFDDCPVLLLANGRLGFECTRFLRERGETICGLIVHPAHQSAYRSEIIENAGVRQADILSPPTLKDPSAARWIAERKPEIITSFWSRYIFPKAVIELAPRGITNLHNSLLPLCRGGEANIWTILDKHDAGVTLHYVNEEIDKGPIIARQKVDCSSWDTGKTLFLRLEAALIALFRHAWPRVRVGPVPSSPQENGGSYHGHRAADRMREVKLDEVYRARELIDRLRAFSFPPYEGAFFFDDAGNKVNLHLELNLVRQSNRDD